MKRVFETLNFPGKNSIMQVIDSKIRCLVSDIMLGLEDLIQLNVWNVYCTKGPIFLL